LTEPVAMFLDRERQANMLIVYTAADRYKDTPEARMPDTLQATPRRTAELKTSVR